MGTPGAVVFTVPPDRHIPVAFQEVFAVLKNRFSVADKERFEELCQLIESISQFEFLEVRRRLKTNFLQFSVGAREQVLQTRVGKGLPTKTDLNDREEKFIGDFTEMLKAAHFNLLSAEEWETAQKEDFNFTLPMDVNWDALDSDMLKRYWENDQSRVDARRELPDIADKILVFHRGVGLAKLNELFINEKIDLLVDYLLVTPAKYVYKRYIKPVLVRFSWKKASLPRAVTKTLQRTETYHRNARTVERRTLKRALPTVMAVIKNLPFKVEITEPTFKDLVVLYRKKIPKAKARKPGQLPPTPEEKLKRILRHRNIYVKSFGEIAMADVDLIFPEKNVFIKPLALIQLAVTVITAIATAVGLLLKGAVDMSVIWSALSLVLARCAQVWSSMQAQKAQMIQDMSIMLYNLTDDSQEGVMFCLLDEMADQQLKETVLAYTLLLIKDQPLSMDDLDNQCEDFCFDNFGLRLDFALENAIPNLERWGMVAEKHGRYSAVPLARAGDVLKAVWGSCYKSLSGDSSRLKLFSLPKMPTIAEISVKSIIPNFTMRRSTVDNSDAVSEADSVVSSASAMHRKEARRRSFFSSFTSKKTPKNA